MHVLMVDPDLDKVIGDAAGRAAWRKRLETAAPEYSFEYVSSQRHLMERLETADVVAGHVGPEALARAPERLKWVHSWRAGPDRQLYDAFVACGIALTCCRGNGAAPLAEHAIMLMLMLQRDAARWLDEQRAQAWKNRIHDELCGKTCAIIGTGHSGSDLALKAKAFHMRVIGLRRSDQPSEHFDQVYRREALHAFLGEADFVVVTVPRTPETTGMLGASEFAAMKPTAFYICISRGGIAEDAALLKSLQERRIAGAGLDALGQEPLPEESPFWSAPNTIVTPHSGGTTLGTYFRGLDVFIENLDRYRDGRPLCNLVEKIAGY